jgi:hypothetical protein
MFVLSANTKPDQNLWFNGFSAFFDLKRQLEKLLKSAKQSGTVIERVDFSAGSRQPLPQGVLIMSHRTASDKDITSKPISP